ATAAGGSDAAGAAGASAPSSATSGSVAFRYLDPAMKPQLDTVFGRMASSLALELHLDERPISAELRGWMEELAACTDKLSVAVAPQEAAAGEPAAGLAAPCVRVLRADGSDTGLAFHGVPGGHEFTSFILGLYNAAGPGQPLDDETRERIAAVAPTHLDVLVSLSCTNCPDVVVAAQRIAADNPGVSTHVYDVAHFPQFKDRYQVMSVPCLVVNEGEKIAFGKKGLSQVLDLLG
uniref:thioredoxin family protein n=1 Tax=Adlercreutzia sp. ZJ242 TaxID=2709409 RepID=UPI0019817844